MAHLRSALERHAGAARWARNHAVKRLVNQQRTATVRELVTEVSEVGQQGRE